MRFEERKFSVEQLAEAFRGGSLVRNPEYQRGAAWNPVQKKKFIDSIMRGYPLPALFLLEIESAGLGGAPSKKWEIVDGQQRLLAMADYITGKYPLLEVRGHSKLRIPKSVQDEPAPWAGKVFDDLTSELSERLLKTEFTVFMVQPETNADEVRDLFIRLQSGTALSRQQIRDAWPGNLGPFVESLAGKLDRQPSVSLFSLVDKRGQRSDDEDTRDRHVADRQLCAQLLLIFLARQSDPYAYPGVSAGNLDDTYHEHTDFDPHGPAAVMFRETLGRTAEVFQTVRELRDGNRTKARRLDVVSTMLFLQDMDRARTVLREPQLRELARHIADGDNFERPAGKTTSGSTLAEYYDWFRRRCAKSIGIRLDANRAFSEEQARQIYERDRGVCQVCGKHVEIGEAEYHHSPIPYRDGGPTQVDNGAVVHKQCHPRGRPPLGE